MTSLITNLLDHKLAKLYNFGSPRRIKSNHGRRQRGAGGRAPLDFQTWYKYSR